MAIDFPNSPATNDTYTFGDKTWIYADGKWSIVTTSTIGPTGPTGPSGNFGGITLDYTFSTNTAASDPGAGFLKFNNANKYRVYIQKSILVLKTIF